MPSSEAGGTDPVRIVAIPREAEGDLDAERSAHFGRAPAFAIVRLDGDTIVSADVMPNSEGHGAAADMLAARGVTDVVTAGIGSGMYRRLLAAGIRVWREQDAPTVSSAIDALVSGQAAPFDEGDVHAGGHGG